MTELVSQLTNGNNTIIIQTNDPIQTLLTAAMFLATVALAILAYQSLVASNKNTKASLDQIKTSNDLTTTSNNEMKESNNLTRQSLDIQLAALRSSLGKPEITLDQKTLDRLKTNAKSKKLLLYPAFRNIGNVAASDINIYHKILEIPADELTDIVKHEQEIKKNVIYVGGVVAPNDFVTRDDGEPESRVEWEEQTKAISVILWFTYEFLDGQQEEVIFEIQYTGRRQDYDATRYDKIDIEKARTELKI